MRKTKKHCALGKLISKRLVDLEETQDWLAKTSKIQPCLISKYCTGNSIPSAQNIYKLAVTLEIDIDKILKAIMDEKEHKAS